jgi:hypothetical protein
MPLQSGFDPLTNRMREPWAVATQIQQLFDVRDLEDGIGEIAEDIDVLMIVHPKGLAESTLYAIDQFVMRGGRALVFVDPFSQFEEIDTDPNNPDRGDDGRPFVDLARCSRPGASSSPPMRAFWTPERRCRYRPGTGEARFRISV